MPIPRIGASFQEATASRCLAVIKQAEALGVQGVWFTSGGGRDPMTAFAAAAVSTSRIHLGTAIVQTFPRHPLVIAQQAADIDELAPGRFTLGLGGGHEANIQGRLGIPFDRPLEHLREYTTIVKQALTGEQVDFEGKRFTVHARLGSRADVPVIISALRERSFELAGEVADGAVTWVCPAPYLRRVALPALERGAQRAGRPAPPLIAHAFLCLTEDRTALDQAVNSSAAVYPRAPNYQAMFQAAGYPEAQQGAWSNGMREAVILSGSEGQARDKVNRFLETSGAAHLILSLLPVGADRNAALERGLGFIAGL